MVPGLAQRTDSSIKGGSSSEQPVSHSVVQDSILGPVLFLLFTNDLPHHIPHGKMAMYASDAHLFDSDYPSSFHEMKERIENSLALAVKWPAQNRPRIKPSKMTCYCLNPAGRTHPNSLCLWVTLKSYHLCEDTGRHCGCMLDVGKITVLQLRYSVLIGSARMRRKYRAR